ncbi:tetratricopeptide repeat protein [Lyngbya aestuarii]|uniref:tetratricopeptide repeat protein n=1 Tax=Lyngbya aestuarii TaxID=118322 RepID=UPI00403DFB59
MPKHIPLFSLLVIFGLLSVQTPASGQALLPYTLQLDSEKLEQQGLNLVQDAVQLVRFQQYELALPKAELAIQLAPDIYQTWFILGTLYVQNQELDKGIAALKKARSLAPDEAVILFNLGSAHLKKEDYQAAVTDLSAGLKLQSEVPEALFALFDLGNAYYMLKDFDKAVSAYDKAVAKEKDFWPAINNIGLVKYEQGDVTGAIDKWQAAIAVDQEAAEPKLAVAVALYGQGELEKAISMGEAAILLDSRYADLEFLKENLWGERLISATQKFLENPKIQDALAKSQQTPITVEVAPE